MFWDLISYFDTAPGSSGGVAAAVSGDSLTVKNAISGTPIRLGAWWCKNQTAGWHQLTFPSGNDTTRNLRAAATAGFSPSLLGRSGRTPLVESETLSLTIAGSGTAGDEEIGCMLINYESLPGQSGEYLTPDDVWNQAVRMVTVEFTLTIGAGVSYAGSEALNAESDLLRPNTRYALLGGQVNTLCAAIAVQAPDWSNGRIGIPGDSANPIETADFFARLSQAQGLPAIPTFNSDNKANILLTAVQDENTANVQGCLNLVQLAS